MWGLGILMGQNWDFYLFRQAYYIEIRVGGVRRIWMPKKTQEAKQRLANLVQKLGYTGSLNDFFDVPAQTHKVVEIPLSGEQKRAMENMTFLEADPLVRRARLRTIENGILYGKKIEELEGKIDQMSNLTSTFKSYKIDYILERALEFPKLLIYANYTAQIEMIANALREEEYNVSVLNGATKDRTFIKKVDDSPEPHIIIAQCSISSGYELPSFPCVIYASKSWRFVDYEQSLGRVLRANKLKKNLYIHLVVEGCDKDCHETIMSGADFQEKLTLNI
jgi:superfamily II DNA or RNA helicase